MKHSEADFFKVTYLDMNSNDYRCILVANCVDEAFTITDILPEAKKYLGEDALVIGIEEVRTHGFALF